MAEKWPDRQPRLRLLGEIALFRDDAFVALPASKKTRALLAYLAATARSHRRERLCDLFWDVPDDPRGSLRWSLSRLRAVLDDETPRIIADRENVALAVDSLAIDLHEIARLLEDESAPLAELQAAADRVEGGFAEGLDLSSCADFQVWLTTQREAARRLHQRLLDRLVNALPADAALPYAQRRLSVDPDCVENHGDVLQLLLANGRRREAEQQAELSIARLGELAQDAASALQVHWRKLQQQSAQSQGAAEITALPLAELDEAPWVEERKQVCVLSAGLRETSLNDDPEVAAERQSPVLQRMIAAIERYRGTVLQRRPDGVTALFGVPIACQNQTVRACLAALAIEESCAGEPFAMAIHAGEILVRHRPGELQAFGPTLRIAQEIERVTPNQKIYLGRPTYRQVEGMFLAEPGADLKLPGLEEPLELLALTDQAAMVSGWYARVIRGLTTFVGRQHEIATLLHVAEKARAGIGQVALIVGEPGLGKSRLLHELFQRKEFRPDTWRLIEAAAAAFDVDTPFSLMGRLLRNWLQVDARLSIGETAARLEAEVKGLDPGLDWTLPALHVLLGLPSDAAWNALDAAVRRRQVIDAVDSVLNALSTAQPLVMLVEDLHWADSDSAAILDALIGRLGKRPVMICVTTRPEGTPSWMARSACQLLRLAALDETAAIDMAQALLGDDASLVELKDLLLERTAGTPLFLEEAVAALTESGALIGARGATRLAQRQDELRVPPTVQAVLGERIDRLAPPLKLLLQVAAVLGDNVRIDVLRPLMELPPELLDARLDALQEAELLFESAPPPQRQFSFKHCLTRDVAYASLLVAQRRKLHRRALKIMLKLRQRGDDMFERLAHHAVHAERWSLAAKFLRQAGDKSVRLSAYREAIRSYELALQMLEHVPSRNAASQLSVVISLRLRPPLGAVAAFTQAFRHLEVAERIVEARGDIRQLISITIHKSYILSSQGQIQAAMATANRARSLADQQDDSLLQLEARLAFGQACAFSGDIAGVIETVTPLRHRLTTELRHERLGQTGLRSVWCLMHLADALTLRGDLAEAREITREAITIAEEVQRPYDRAVSHLREGFIEIQAGNPHKAIAAFDRSRALAEGSDLGWVAAWARAGLGYAYVAGGHTEAGLHLLEAVKRQAIEAEFVAVEAMSTIYLADARRRCGQWREAAHEAELALAAARRWGYKDIEVMAFLCLGQVAIGRQEADEVTLKYLRDAATLAEQRGYRLMLAEANQLMAPILEQKGETEAAAAANYLAEKLLQETG